MGQFGANPPSAQHSGVPHTAPDTDDTEDDGSATRFAAFLNWVRTHGGRAEKMTLGDVNGVRAILTSEPVAAQDELIHLPWRLAVTVDAARNSRLGRMLAARGQSLSDRGHLACYLAETRRDGGFWGPYVDVLPDSFPGHPLLLEPHEFQRLNKRFYTTSLIETHRESCAREFAKVSAGLPEGERFTADEFAWAYCCVLSRSYNMETDGALRPLMLPVVDMFNHDRAPNLRREPADAAYGAAATRPMPAGTELLTTYGERMGNQVLCPLYGFTLEDNPSDITGLFVNSRGFIVPAGYASDAVQAMFAFLRESLQGPSSASGGTRVPGPVDRENELACLTALGAACQERLDDLATPPSHALSLRARHVEHACQGELRILRHYVELATQGVALLQSGGPVSVEDTPLAALDRAYAVALGAMLAG